MFLGILSLLFVLLVIQGFARVVRYFWGWLRGGEKISDARLVGEEQVAERAASAAADRDLEGVGELDRPQQVARVARTERDVVDEYLDNMHMGLWQIVMVFFIGCIAGLLVEEVWMFLTAGLTQSRVGLVWGPFSPLYGFGAVFLTLVCYAMRRKHAKDWQIFLVSVVIGGVLEQVTGWSMETLFHATSWSYLHLPDHITKWVAWRFLFFWGVLGLVWCKAVMPQLLYRIGMPTTRRQAVFVTLLAVYLVADIVMTLVCFDRKTARDAGVPPQNAFEEWVDAHYTDEFISTRFQNLVIGDDQ